MCGQVPGQPPGAEARTDLGVSPRHDRYGFVTDCGLAIKGSKYHRLCFCARHRCEGHCCHDCGKRCFYPNKHANFAKNTRACQCIDHCWVKDVPAEWPASGSASPAGAFRKTLSQLQRTGANPHWIKPDRYSHNLQERQRDAERDQSRERRRAASAERRRRQTLLP